MPKKTLIRNEKTGAWNSTVEALPSEIEQKKQVLPEAEDIQAEKPTKSTKKQPTTASK